MSEYFRTDVFIDIETLPSNDYGSFYDRAELEISSQLDAIKAPSNYKDEAKIQDYIESKREELIASIGETANKAHRASALDGGYGDIFCIAIAVENKDVTVYEPVKAIEVLKDLKRIRLIGHNVSFDTTFIWKWALRQGIAMPMGWPVNPKPWDTDTTYCTMSRWAGAGQRIKLDALAKILGLEGKTKGMDGSKVYDAWLDGRHDEIREYCANDVEITRKIFNKIGDVYAPMG